MMNNFIFLNKLSLFIIFLLSVFETSLSFGQGLFIEKAEAKVIIKKENLVRAKAEALKEAKSQVILKALRRFIDFDSTISLKLLLKKHFLDKPDFFIESIRVISEGNTLDLSEFSLKIETQILPSRLLTAFRQLGLPTQEERIPIRDVFLLYNSENVALSKAKVLKLFLSELKAKLRPYRIRPNLIVIKKNDLTLEDTLKSRLRLLPNKNSEDSKRINPAMIELKLDLSSNTSQNISNKLNTQLIFWSQKDGIIESSRNKIRSTAELSFDNWNPEKVIPLILDKLVLDWTPVIRETLEIDREIGEKIILKIKGIPGPIEEQAIIKTLFKNKPLWRQIKLTTISRKFLTYEAIFLGKGNNILQGLSVPFKASFAINSVDWDDKFLVIEVKWKEKTENLDQFKESTLQSELFESDSLFEELAQPRLQVPLRTLKQTYSLPLKKSVYDHIRHRGDSTLFKIKVPSANSFEKVDIPISISWFRLGKTNLKPKITLYDQDRKSLNIYSLGRKKIFNSKFIIPKYNKVFYIRISDEVGFLEDVAGSYQSFRYVLKIN